ncbi:glycerate kinase [Bacillus sp. 165]|uniref:glycerate kinase family protein n=1 Tax=Bacillus sp. 165 TaxID=1529117 RepID=UPI001ADA6F72|nr:glycerate kinase [Bacillus sp. 165]MBO9130153.1 glycerate kinase [Bacillus sp. 165]
MKYVIASDSFKGSLSAIQVGRAVKQGILHAHPEAQVKIVPMADGGEGTLEALLYANRGHEMRLQVHNPLMQPVLAKYAVFHQDGKDIVFIECAQSSGLPLIAKNQRNPMNTNTYGLGEQIKDAVQRGYRHFIISLGGSATNDGGVGMLQALGWNFFDKKGQLIRNTGNPLLHIHSFSDTNKLPQLDACTFMAATDVINPFYGPHGAAFIFARQKGATDQEISVLDTAMQKFEQLLTEQYGVSVQTVSGAGAAGGLGGSLAACLQAEITSGAELIMQHTNLEEHVRKADIVITGEGSLDEQTLLGKVPIAVAKLAKKHGKLVIGIAGRIDTDLNSLNAYLDAVFSIQTECLTLEYALTHDIAYKQVEVTAGQIAQLIKKLSL